MKRQRLDEILVQLGLFTDLKTARGWIMSGKIVVNGKVEDKPGALYRPNADVFIRGKRSPFASRGGYKLEHALRRFDIALDRKVCLDAGASKGGFTDCMLQHGAAKVYAVEVGYGQLSGRLAADPRVISLERTNIGDLLLGNLCLPISFAAADLSYLSLTKAMPIIARLFVENLNAVCLVKPLYEGLSQDRMADKSALQKVLASLFSKLDDMGLMPRSTCSSPILGRNGTLEFLAHFDSEPAPFSSDELAARAIDDLMANPPHPAPID